MSKKEKRKESQFFGGIKNDLRDIEREVEIYRSKNGLDYSAMQKGSGSYQGKLYKITHGGLLLLLLLLLLSWQGSTKVRAERVWSSSLLRSQRRTRFLSKLGSPET